MHLQSVKSSSWSFKTILFFNYGRITNNERTQISINIRYLPIATSFNSFCLDKENPRISYMNTIIVLKKIYTSL